MPRNGTGTFSKLNTFNPNETALSSAVNANFDDVGSEITNSVPRDGQAAMTGAFKLASGTTSAPSMTFSSDQNSGLYRKDSDQVGMVAGGTEVGYWTTSGLTVDALTSDGAATISGTLSGADATFSSTLGVTGAATLSSTLAVTGTSSLADVTASSTITATGAIAANGGLTGTTATMSGNVTGGTLTSTGDVDATGDVGGATATITGTATVGGVACSGTATFTGTVALGSATVTGFNEGVPSGTRMIFQQTAAPTGWTKETNATNYNDRVMRVVTGTPTIGGIQAFSTVFNRTSVDSHVLTINEIPYHDHGGGSHTHTYTRDTNTANVNGASATTTIRDNSATVDTTGASGTIITGQGGSLGHIHTFDNRVTYVDFIIATKN